MSTLDDGLIDERSWTTKEELLEALQGLPDGAKIYQFQPDEELSHGDDHLVAAPSTFNEINTREESRRCGDHRELIVTQNAFGNGTGWILC